MLVSLETQNFKQQFQNYLPELHMGLVNLQDRSGQTLRIHGSVKTF